MRDAAEFSAQRPRAASGSAVLVARLPEALAPAQCLRDGRSRHSRPCGLGSGTQLALALARAFRALNDLPSDTLADAGALVRGGRSGLGVAFFERGGFMLDAGRGPTTILPPVSRVCRFRGLAGALLLDDAAAGAHGEDERSAFARLPPFPREAAADIAGVR